MSDETEVTADTKGKSDADLLELARSQYKAADEACDQNYQDALADLNFLVGGTNQWDPLVVAARTMQKRPMITVNVLPTYLHQVTNDQRMNTPSIKVHPVDDDADVETAKVFQGLIRHIEYDSNADVAQDTAVNSAAGIGFGWWRLITEFCNDGSFNNQDIKYRRIRNALSVKIDPLSVEPDGSDMQYAFIECLMAKAEFKRKYPKAKASDESFFSGISGNADYAGWFKEAGVLVCEWYCIETEEVEVVELSTGESGFIDELVPNGKEEKLPEGTTIAKRRDGERKKVMWYRITGCDVLEKTEIKSKWIPIFPVYGDEVDIQGQVVRSGIIRNAKGPAQMYNVFMTSATEEVALRGKNPYMMAEGQEAGHEDEFAQINVTPMPYVTYRPVALGEHLAPPPQRQPMADVPVGHLQMAMHSADNIKKTTGLFDASLGAKGTATSGVQERAQQKEGDVANYHYMDGLLRSLRHCGRCLVSMIPNYYDAQRTIRILGEEDVAQHVTINEPNVNGQPNKAGDIKKILNDLTVGKYDITISNGPSYSTMRQESAEFFANALSASKDPAQAAVMGYLAIKNQDIKDGETATKMLATTLPPAAKAVLDEENGDKGEQEQTIPTPKGPLPVSQVPQALQALEQQIQQMGEALQKADGDKQQAEVLRHQEGLLKQQAAVADQQLEPVRNATEQKKAEAEIAKANATTEQAKAATIQAQADLVRANLEMQTLPQKLEIEAAQSKEKACQAEMQLRAPPEEKEPDVTLDQIMALIKDNKPVLPPSMVIRAPSGQTYTVEIPRA